MPHVPLRDDETPADEFHEQAGSPDVAADGLADDNDEHWKEMNLEHMDKELDADQLQSQINKLSDHLKRKNSK